MRHSIKRGFWTTGRVLLAGSLLLCAVVTFNKGVPDGLGATAVVLVFTFILTR